MFDAADRASLELIVTFGVPGPRGCRTLGGVWLEMTGLPPPVPERVGGILSGEAEELRDCARSWGGSRCPPSLEGSSVGEGSMSVRVLVVRRPGFFSDILLFLLFSLYVAVHWPSVVARQLI